MTQTLRGEVVVSDVIIYSILDYQQKYIAVSPKDSYDSAWINLKDVDAVIDALKEVREFVLNSDKKEGVRD